MTVQLEKIKSKVTRAVEVVRERYSFRDIVEMWKGSQDVEKRAGVILDPKNPKTSTNLSANQVDFVSIVKSIVPYFPEFEALDKYANELLSASSSKDGWGVDRAIAYQQAIGEKRLMEIRGVQPQSQSGGQTNVE